MRRKMNYWLIAPILAAALWAAGSSKAEEKARAPAPQRQSPQATQVVVIATQHFISDMPDGYTPGHLRAVLKRAAPDLLAVEAPAGVSDPWQLAPLDLWQVTKPWADEKGVAAVPVGSYEPLYGAQIDRMLGDFRAAGNGAAYEEAERAFQTKYALRPHTCEEMNGDASRNLWRDYHAALHRLYGKDTPWEAWNAKIVANIIRTCREHPGRKVAVVFGEAHCYYIADKLANEDGILVESTSALFPLSDEDVQAETRPTDFLKALRPLNFPNYGALTASALARLEGFLDKVKDYPELQGDYHLFNGKLLLHRLKPAEGLQEFGQVAALPANAVSAFDGKSLLREAGLVFAAVAKAQTGDIAQARQDLADVLGMPGTTESTKGWVRQLLASLPAPGRGVSTPH